ncbi:MAG: polysaccharide biosynthesis tyrosine autokinase, partial [Flavobacteriales bacterium]
NRIIINDLNARISIEESSLNSLPIEQRELLNIERIQKTSEKLYMFLLQKKSEAEITSSSITSNIQHLEPSSFFVKPPLFPNASQWYSIALLIGVLLPLFLLLLLDLINDKIRSRIDLERISKIDIIGVIGRNHSGNNLLTKLNPKSAIAEGFRSLRSNLNYKDKEDKDKIYLVTSSVSGEGKTFIASNLGVVFANSGKKTLLLGADLRRPKLYEGFNVDNSIGLSTVLDGSSSVDEVISNVEENLDIIIAGPLPSNPADVFLSDKFEELINTLKNKYDKIIIDTAPIGLVADAYMIMKHTDVNMYVVRQNYTNKDVLRFVNDLEENNRVENLYLVLNDVSSGSGVYGYGKYSYGYGMYYTENGDEFKKYSVYDGMGFQLLQKTGVKVGIVTTEDKQMNRRRSNKLGLDYDFHGVKDKLQLIKNLCKQENIFLENIAYIGDDVNCFDLLSNVGVAACPKNAMKKIKSIPNIIQLQKNGGEGVVREFIELILS